MATDDRTDSPLLLYDGRCALCQGIVRFILRHERRQTLEFAPLDGPTAQRMIADRPDLAHTDAVMWVDRDPDGAARRIDIRSAAALRVAGYLGGPWMGLGILRIIPRPLRDVVYDAVARRRHRLAARCQAKPWPLRDRSRFHDHG